MVEGHTAYLDEPYADALEYKGDASYRGDPIWPPAQMKKAFAKLDKAGFQIQIHSIGDAATTESLDALAYAQKVNGKHDWRPDITHLQLVDPKDYRRFAKLGVTAVPDPYWFVKDDYYTYLQVPYPGPDARGPRVPDVQILRRRRQRGVRQRLPGHRPAGPAGRHRRRREPLGPDLRVRVPDSAGPGRHPLAE